MTPLEHWRAADKLMAEVEVAKVRMVSTLTIDSMVSQAKAHAELASAGFSLLNPAWNRAVNISDVLFADE